MVSSERWLVGAFCMGSMDGISERVRVWVRKDGYPLPCMGSYTCGLVAVLLQP